MLNWRGSSSFACKSVLIQNNLIPRKIKYSAQAIFTVVKVEQECLQPHLMSRTTSRAQLSLSGKIVKKSRQLCWPW